MKKIDLRLGDCLELMKSIPDASIDAVITSPPYDNLRVYGGNEWDFRRTASELFRIIKDGGVVVWIKNDETINGSETGTSFREALFFMELGFNLHDTMIWNKGSCRYPEINRYYPTFEYMFILSKHRPVTHNLIDDRKNIYAGSKVARKKQTRKKNGEIVENSAYRIDPNRTVKEYGVRFNVWNIPVSASTDDSKALKHPATFPVQLATDHARTWTNEADTILDPFMGSGTTGVASVNTNRNFIGMEIFPEYFQIAQIRIAEAQANYAEKEKSK